MFGKWMDQESRSVNLGQERTNFTTPTEGSAMTNGSSSTTNLGPDTHFKGSLTFERTLKIEGTFEGDINTTGTLLIGKGAQVKAEIKAKNVTIEGNVTGNVTAEEKLHIMSSAHLAGDIKAGKLIIEEQAVIVGRCEVSPKEEKRELPRPPAVEEEAYKVPVQFNSSLL